MNITKKQCEEFKKNPTTNPLTGRTIHIGKITHQNLLKACKENPIEVINSVTPIRTYEIPPMGIMIHWKYNSDGLSETNRNFIKFFNYIDKRVGEILEENVISEMELVEIVNVLKEAKERFKDKSHLDIVTELKKDISKIKRTHTIIPDLPKEIVVNYKYIKSDRLYIRENIVDIYNLYKNAMHTMKYALKNKKIGSNIQRGRIKNIVSDKIYLDYVIEHKIFTYDDIYKHTFSSEKVFEELKKTYKEWVKLYKKTEGESPI